MSIGSAQIRHETPSGIEVASHDASAPSPVRVDPNTTAGLGALVKSRASESTLDEAHDSLHDGDKMLALPPVRSFKLFRLLREFTPQRRRDSRNSTTCALSPFTDCRDPGAAACAEKACACPRLIAA